MDPILEKVVLTIVGILVSGLITWLGAQIVRYRKLIKDQEDTNIKKTIDSSLEAGLKPIQESITNINSDITNMKTDITNMQSDITNMKSDIQGLQKFETNFSTRLEPTQEEIEHLKDDITEILETLKAQGVDLQNIREKEQHLEKETRCAWRYRIRQLCHIYIARGYMSYEEYTQLQEMFNIYAAIGGNGQTQELYERTMDLEIKTDAEIAALKAQSRGSTCPLNGGNCQQ